MYYLSHVYLLHWLHAQSASKYVTHQQPEQFVTWSLFSRLKTATVGLQSQPAHNQTILPIKILVLNTALCNCITNE